MIEITIGTGLSIYLVVCVLMTLFLTTITVCDTVGETNVLKKAFHIQRAVWMELEDALNTAGLVIITEKEND